MSEKSEKDRERQKVLHKAATRAVFNKTGLVTDKLVAALKSTVLGNDGDLGGKTETEADILKILEDVSDAAQVYLSEAINQAEAFDIEDEQSEMLQAIKDEESSFRLIDCLEEALVGELHGAQDYESDLVKSAISEILSELGKLDDGLSDEALVAASKETVSVVAEKLLGDAIKDVVVPVPVIIFSDQPLEGNTEDSKASEEFDPHLTDSVGQLGTEAADDLINKLLLGGN